MGFLFDITYYYEVEPGVPIEVKEELDIKPFAFFEEELLPNFIVPGVELVIPQPQDTFTYIVVEGDNLDNIAKKFNVSVDEIVELTELEEIALNIGDILLIPSKSTEEQITKTIDHKVLVGETLSQIAQKYNTTVEKIAEDNDLENFIVFPDQVLKIMERQIPSFSYTVKEGDSLGIIAKRYTSTVEDIRKENELTSDEIKIGQKLEIPLTDIEGDKIPPNYTEYIVQQGDTIDSISERFKTDPETIIKLNALIPFVEVLPDIISELSTGFIRYRVDEGDTLSSVATKVRVPLAEILEVNPELDGESKLSIGDIIQIPVLPLTD